MPQELHVVRCFSCETFQVDIVKKIPKWVCKMCGEKQTVKKVYGRGTGKDCRAIVQGLNQQRISLQNQFLESAEHNENTRAEFLVENPTSVNDENKWSEFLVGNPNCECEEEPSTFVFERSRNKRQNMSGQIYAAEEVNKCFPQEPEHYLNEEPNKARFSQVPVMSSSSKWSEFCSEERASETQNTRKSTTKGFKNGFQKCSGISKLFADEDDLDSVLRFNDDKTEFLF